MSIIEANGVTKKYGRHLALDNISLKVEEGSVFALLGPNGAGKTTFVKSLLGLVRLNKGELSLKGNNVKEAISREGVGYLPEKFSFYPYYTVYGCVAFFGKMNGISGAELHEKVLDSLKKTGALEIKDKRIDSISKGQLQRTGVATLLVGDSDLLILDEPFSGLDPLGIKELKDLIQALAKDEHKTIFINSHILSEMEKICQSMAILNKGKVVVSGEINSLLKGETLEDFFYKLIKDNS